MAESASLKVSAAYVTQHFSIVIQKIILLSFKVPYQGLVPFVRGNSCHGEGEIESSARDFQDRGESRSGDESVQRTEKHDRLP